MEKVTIPKGDKGFNLTYTIHDADGTAKNLTSYTVKLTTWVPGVPETPVIDSAECTITDAANGICTFAVLAAHTAAVGKWYAELELTQADIIESTMNFLLVVEESG